MAAPSTHLRLGAAAVLAATALLAPTATASLNGRSAAPPAPTTVDSGATLPAAAAAATTGLAFEPNLGQQAGPAQFLAPVAGGQVSLDRTGVQLLVAEPAPTDRVADADRGDTRSTLRRAGLTSPPIGGEVHELRVRFLGSRPDVLLRPARPLPGVVHYLQGADPRGWQQDLPTYAAVDYLGVYPGIDLRYDGTAGVLKGTWTVAPGIDPRVIGWDYGPGSRLRLSPTGDLLVTLADGSTLPDRAPIAWQDTATGRMPVRVAYQLRGTAVGFTLGAYDRSRPLVIDPELVFSRLVGATSPALYGPTDLTQDRRGNLFLVGYTVRYVKDRTTGLSQAHDGDVVVVAVTPDGRVRWRTVLRGSKEDYATAITADGSGRLHLTGMTDSVDFPVRRADQPRKHRSTKPTHDAFVAALDPAGRLVYSTYFGGGRMDWAVDVATAPDGTTTIGGATESTDLPVRNALQPRPPTHRADVTGLAWGLTGFLATYSPTGTRLGSTYLGSSSGGWQGGVSALRAHPSGDGSLFVGGNTVFCDLPAQSVVVPCPIARVAPPDGTTPVGFGTNSAGYVLKLAPNGRSVPWVAYLGGSGAAVGAAARTWTQDIDVDSRGTVTAVGTTNVVDFPVTVGAAQPGYGGGQLDGWAVAIHGEGLVYGTYVGGDGSDFITRVKLDRGRQAVVTGGSNSQTYPTLNAYQRWNAGDWDVVVTRLTYGGQLRDSTYVGGSGQDGYSGQYNGFVLANNGDPIVATNTKSVDFPLRGSQRRVSDVTGDSVLFRLHPDTPGPPPVDLPGLELPQDCRRSPL